MNPDRTASLKNGLAARAFVAATLIGLLRLFGCAGVADRGAGRGAADGERLCVAAEAVSGRTHADLPGWRGRAIEDAAALLPAEYRADVIQALGRAGENTDALIAAIRAVPEDQREGIAFLIANMPDCDLRGLDKDLLVENVGYAYKAWRECPWSKQIPKELFLNDVLPYANLDEPRDRWRRPLFDRFREKAWKQKTPGEAAKFLNANMFPELKVSFHKSKRPRPNMSPLETMAINSASCTGLSVLFVDACRAVGIPARVAGVPMWTDKSGNHTWAEVWDGQWYSLGAAEPTGFNGGWYINRAGTTDPGKPEHCIYAASFRKTGTRFIVAWDPGNEWIPAVDVTAFYRDLVKKPEPKPGPAKPDGARP